MSKAKEVVAHEEKLPVAAALSVSFEQDVGGGFEDADQESFAIPFLQILQSGSPQVKRSEGAYIEGAQEGMIINTVTNAVYDVFKTPVPFIPVYTKREYVEWKTREKGGGFVAAHPVSSNLITQTKRDEMNRDILPNGNQLVDTRYHYGLKLSEDGTFERAVITMSSTQIRRSKKWNTMAANILLPKSDGSGMYTPPLFSHVYMLSTEAENNDKGSWFSWNVKLQGPVPSTSLYAAARAFRDSIKKGEVKEATDSLKGSDATTSSDVTDDESAF